METGLGVTKIPVSRRAFTAGLGLLALGGRLDAQSADDPEPVLLPTLPIVDPHHHLWDANLTNGIARYHAPELLADIDSGHHVIATVFVECGSHYETTGPEAMRPVGETRFVMTQSAADPRIACGIVGHADLMLGDAVVPVLEAHMAAAEGRFRGIRQMTAYDPDPIFKIPDASMARRLDDPRFRAGFARLAPLGLSFDAWGFHTNLPQIARLAAAFPSTRVIVDHTGSPLGIGPYAGSPKAMFDHWRTAMKPLAELPNILLKFGGLGMPMGGVPLAPAGRALRDSATLAELWRPWFQTCLDLFGPQRMMFESNFPVDKPNGSYRTLWNAFKRLALPLSPDERTALFSGTAGTAYRLTLKGSEHI